MKWNDVFQSIINDATRSNIPVSGFFEITSLCNFHCRMCYVCSMPDDNSVAENELTSDQWISIGREARDAGLLFLTLTGGEIFMRKDFWEIYEAFTRMGFKITLFTNASLLNEERVKRLAKTPPSKVSITLYGASPETYGKVTGHSEAYERTLNGINLLASEGINIELKTTLVSFNRYEFDALSEITRSFGKSLNVVNYISPRREGSGTDPEAVRLDPYDLAEYEKRMEYRNISKKQSEGENAVNASEIDNDNAIGLNTRNTNDDKELVQTEQSAFRCSAGKCAFWLTWDGHLTPCGLLGEPYSEPLKLGFSNAWKQLSELCSKVPTCTECSTCIYRKKCMACPGRLKTETGYFNKISPYLCEHAKARVFLNVPY